MATRHPNHRLVKSHRSYTVEEMAGLFKVHKNTIRRWIKLGLPTIDKKRPFLVQGHDLINFIQVRRTKNQCSCELGELYCVRCREPRKPAGGMVEYELVTPTTGNLIAICPVCDSIMNRRTSPAKLAVILRVLNITMPQAQRHITESAPLSVNSDLQKEHLT